MNWDGVFISWPSFLQIPEEDEEIDEDIDDEEQKEDLDAGVKMFTKTQILKLHGSLSKEDLEDCDVAKRCLLPPRICMFGQFFIIFLHHSSQLQKMYSQK